MIQRLLYCQRRGRSLHLQQKTVEIVQTITGAAPLARVQRNSFKPRVPNKNMYDALTYSSSNLQAPLRKKSCSNKIAQITPPRHQGGHSIPHQVGETWKTRWGTSRKNRLEDKLEDKTGRQAVGSFGEQLHHATKGNCLRFAGTAPVAIANSR